MQTIEYLFDFGSPNAYLTHRVIPQLEDRLGVKFVYAPILLGGIFKATNNLPPMVALGNIPNKLNYMFLETERWLQRYGVAPYVMNPHFPVNTLKIMRGAVYAQDQDWYADYIEAMFQCMWEKGLKMDDDAVIAEAFADYGLPKDELLAAMSDAGVKQGLMDRTQNAADRGAFGSPTFFVGEEMFFGKDSLYLVEELVASG